MPGRNCPAIILWLSGNHYWSVRKGEGSETTFSGRPWESPLEDGTVKAVGPIRNPERVRNPEPGRNSLLKFPFLHLILFQLFSCESTIDSTPQCHTFILPSTAWVILRRVRNREPGRNSHLFIFNCSKGYFGCRSTIDSTPQCHTFILPSTA